MVSTFAKGALVHLKSGSPAMTVTSVSTDHDVVILARYTDGKVVTESICPEALVAAVPQSKPWLAVFVDGEPALELTSGIESVLVDWPLARLPETRALIERAHNILLAKDEATHKDDTLQGAAIPAQGDDTEAFRQAIRSQLPLEATTGQTNAELVLPVSRSSDGRLCLGGDQSSGLRPE